MPTLSLRSRGNSGFTLMEVMIVLAIIASVLSVALPKLIHREEKIQTVARNLTNLAKEVRNRARMNNSTYRIVFKLDKKNPEYWVERAPGLQLLDAEKTKAEREKPSFRDDEKPKPIFQMDKSFSKKPLRLPAPYFFNSLETANSQEPITEGENYIHFFPEGLVEAAALQISTDKNMTWTLVFNPLTGQAEILNEAKTLKDIAR